MVSWMTSMTEFAPIVLPVLQSIKPQRIAEIGASAGGHSKMLADFLRPLQGRLFSIDPMPQQSFLDWVKMSGDVVTHIRQASLTGIAEVSRADVWFIDGDHNWYTVYHELLQIEAKAREHQSPLFMFLHDVSWPCARRDMYYNPQAIPAEYLHPYSSELGITLDNPHSFEGGFKGPNWALKEGGARNGILTAVEDFLAVSQTQFHWIHIPAVLGLGILIDKKHPHANEIADFYKPYNNNPLIATIEKDRVAKYLAACELNEKIAKLSSILTKLSQYCETTT